MLKPTTIDQLLATAKDRAANHRGRGGRITLDGLSFVLAETTRDTLTLDDAAALLAQARLMLPKFEEYGTTDQAVCSGLALGLNFIAQNHVANTYGQQLADLVTVFDCIPERHSVDIDFLKKAALSRAAHDALFDLAEEKLGGEQFDAYLESSIERTNHMEPADANRASFRELCGLLGLAA